MVIFLWFLQIADLIQLSGGISGKKTQLAETLRTQRICSRPDLEGRHNSAPGWPNCAWRAQEWRSNALTSRGRRSAGAGDRTVMERFRPSDQAGINGHWPSSSSSHGKTWQKP
jgi:hypothetical protein